MPAVVRNDPGNDRCNDSGSDGRAACHDAGRQRPLRIREPFVDGVQGHRKRRTFGGSQDHATGEQQRETRHPYHGKQRKRPDQRHAQHQHLGANVIGRESDHNAGEGKQQEKRATQRAELGVAQTEVSHDGHAGEADHRLVRVIHEHEQEYQSDMHPRLGGLPAGRRTAGRGF